MCATAIAICGCASPGGSAPSDPALTPVSKSAASASTRAVPGVFPKDRDMNPRAIDPNESRGAGTLLIYSSVAGHVPYRSVTRDGVIYRARTQEEREAARASGIEDEISAALARQEGLAFESTEGAEAPDLSPPDIKRRERVSRIAPLAPEPELRRATSLHAERIVVPEGAWGNDRAFEVVRHDADVDGDGTADEIRFIEPESGVLLRTSRDLDADGESDSWDTFDRTGLVGRMRDTDGDGSADLWEEYGRGRLTARHVDRNRDGAVDAVYRYQGVSLVEERLDSDRDGAIDLVLSYENRVLVRSEEDRNHDGQTDTWTSYRLVGGDEVASRIARDRDADGSADIRKIFEESEPSAPDDDLAPL